MHEYFTADFKGKDKPRGFGRGLAAEKIIGLLYSWMLCLVQLTSLHLRDDGRHELSSWNGVIYQNFCRITQGGEGQCQLSCEVERYL